MTEERRPLTLAEAAEKIRVEYGDALRALGEEVVEWEESCWRSHS